MSSPLRAILVGGIACGVLDLAFALIFYTIWREAKPMNILRSISAGVLGANAQKGGVPAAVFGVTLHFVISFGAATGFYLLSRRLRFLTDHAVVSGILYGALFYFFMNGVVLPLSAVPNAPFPPVISMRMLPTFVAHLFCVGLPIGLAVRRWARG